MLGHQVRCGDGVSAAPKKVKDIVAMLRPHNIQVLQSFLGSAVYLIRFVKDFAELRGPLYDLCKLRKTPEAEITDDMWTDRCQRSFMSVKAALASAPVLAFTDFTAPFIILADCSKFRLGGALVQRDSSGRERVIAYMSKRLNKTQQGYGVTSKELLAVQHCVRRWRAYLHGHPTIVVTDHKALLSLNTRAEFDRERLGRMAAELMEYDLVLVHRPGRQCDLSDLMSRAGFEEDPEVREKMLLELAAWMRKMEQEQLLEPISKSSRPPKPDDIVAFEPDLSKPPPWAQSQASRALEGDETAYDADNTRRYLQLMIRGAVIDPNEADTCETLNLAKSGFDH